MADAVLVPVPHERFVEVGFAFVRPLHDDVDVDDLQAHLRSRLAGFKAPKHVKVVAELPRTGSGKVDRRLLTDQAAVLVAQQSCP